MDILRKVDLTTAATLVGAAVSVLGPLILYERALSTLKKSFSLPLSQDYGRWTMWTGVLHNRTPRLQKFSDANHRKKSNLPKPTLYIIFSRSHVISAIACGRRFARQPLGQGTNGRPFRRFVVSFIRPDFISRWIRNKPISARDEKCKALQGAWIGPHFCRPLVRCIPPSVGGVARRARRNHDGVLIVKNSKTPQI